jgi:hypothetical protein
MLPRETEYRVSSLPAEVSSAAYVSRAVNGTTFTAGQQVQVNLIQNRGAYVLPNSIYATFNINVTAGAADNAILGIPACSVIQRLDTFANSTSVETVNNYNAVTNLLFNGKLGVSEKMGLSKPFGLELTAGGADVLCDSRTIDGGSGANIISCSVPICSVLSNSDKLLPMSSAEYRLYFTVEDIANIACLSADGAATTLTAFSLSDFEVHYKCVTFDPQTDAMIMSQVSPDGSILFKTESYQSSVAAIANGTQGSVAIPFANSLTSIKSLLTTFSRTDRYRLGSGVSYDVTGGAGSLNYEVAGKNYPQTPLSLTSHASAVPLEFLEAIHGVMSHPAAAQTSMSVDNFRVLNVAFGTDPLRNLSKAYFGYNCEKLPSSSALNGISSQNSNIVLRVNIDGAATGVASTALQIFHHDVIMKYDPVANTLVVMR